MGSANTRPKVDTTFEEQSDCSVTENESLTIYANVTSPWVKLGVVDLRRKINLTLRCNLAETGKRLYEKVRKDAQLTSDRGFLLSFQGKVIQENSEKPIGDYGVTESAQLICNFRPV